MFFFLDCVYFHKFALLIKIIIMENKQKIEELKSEGSKLNSFFVLLMWFWTIGNFFRFYTTLMLALVGMNFENNGIEIFLLPILHFALAISLILIINLKRSGVYILIALSCITLVVNIITMGFTLGLFSMLFVALFFLLFFTLKKNGRTAYDVIFKNKE